MPKNSATVSATSMPRPTVASDDLLARGFVGRSFIGVDDRPRGGRLLVNAGTSYRGAYHSRNSLAASSCVRYSRRWVHDDRRDPVRVPSPAPTRRSAGDAERVGRRVGPAVRLVGVRRHRHDELGVRRHARPGRRRGQPRGGARPHRGAGGGDAAAGQRRPRGLLRRRPGRRRGDDHRGGGGRCGRRLGRGLHARRRPPDPRHRAGHRARRRRRRGGAGQRARRSRPGPRT